METEAPKLSRRQPDGLNLEKCVVFHVHGGRAPAQMTFLRKRPVRGCRKGWQGGMTTDSRQPLYLLVTASPAPNPMGEGASK